MSDQPPDALDHQGRRIGMIAVIQRNNRLLTIRRAASVRKPGKVCFPGGGLWRGEEEEAAVRREVKEELGLTVRPIACLDRSVSPWGTSLRWYLCQLVGRPYLELKSHEVAEVFWCHPETLLNHPDLLESNAPFLERWLRGEFREFVASLETGS